MVHAMLSLLRRGRTVDARPEGSRKAPAAPLVHFTRERFGRWTVIVADHEPRIGFADIAGAVAYARRLCAAAPATLWFRVDGLVIVIPQDSGWTRLMLGERT